MASCITRYGAFTHWWACLPAVPPSRDALDWWVSRPDGRCSRYQRLRRVWADTTRLLQPKDDPLRPHEFSKPSHSTHLTCRIFESFCIFHPDAWLKGLLDLAGIASAGHWIDCSWSYEFEAEVDPAGRRFKLADIVVHGRRADDAELLLVFEVKRPGDRLKVDCDHPDTLPSSYLDRFAFASFPHRRLVYLVDAEYAQVVRNSVDRTDDRWSIITWSQVEQLQLSLVSLLPSTLQPLARYVMLTAFADGALTSTATPDTMAGDRWWDDLRMSENLAPHLADFAAGALQFIQCRQGQFPERLAFEHLQAEPSFADISLSPKKNRQTILERRLPLWRLPSGKFSQDHINTGDAVFGWLSRRNKQVTGDLPMQPAKPASEQARSADTLASSFPSPASLHTASLGRFRPDVEEFFKSLRTADGPPGGITIGRKGKVRVLCYVGPLPTGADSRLRSLLGRDFQVSAVRDPQKIHNYKTIVGPGVYHASVDPHQVRDRAPAGSKPLEQGETPLARARRVLGLAPDAELTVVQAAYRALAAKYHPDRMAGRSPTDVDAAHARFIEIKDAYDALMGENRAHAATR